ncbi:hypothetical protein DFP72DRAFT_574565 [Ephemerocybe angulata]|uniref:Uncharacterized protein n=1 Tax=Ephemerocybe angulata TaxID=980116 RepID=A0A8H6HKY3_9AGAR|nr:hypothetical protein DFP72DRAFT_574565 [Tulosesus angulatus]
MFSSMNPTRGRSAPPTSSSLPLPLPVPVVPRSGKTPSPTKIFVIVVGFAAGTGPAPPGSSYSHSPSSSLLPPNILSFQYSPPSESPSFFLLVALAFAFRFRAFPPSSECFFALAGPDFLNLNRPGSPGVGTHTCSSIRICTGFINTPNALSPKFVGKCLVCAT